jgi:hypothetical protein
MTEFLVEIAGWAGALLILLSYILVSAGRLSGQSVLFQMLNLFGAIGFIVNSGWHGAIPSMALNIIWCAIALYTLVRIRWPSTLPPQRKE